ncbi:MAG TPA: GatB/YqeY domain-containing protein [Candidatus Limnocylindria bacterium]|nr:GatB/YqeY domain-containing protein [Candidatus Limnocylindria bacterium]
MTLLARIESAMRDAMRAGDRPRTSTLRMAMAAATNRRIELGREVTDDDMVDVLTRQVKQRRESIELYRGAGRDDRAEAELAEVEILSEFLPRQLSAGELEALATEAIEATGASGPADLGRVMGWLVPRTKGRADGRAVSEAVRRRLSERGG